MEANQLIVDMHQQYKQLVNTAKSQIIVLEHNEFFKKKQTNIEI